MRDDPDTSAVSQAHLEVLRDADALLALAAAGDPNPFRERLKLARDELGTKILRARPTAEAERAAEDELSRAAARLSSEIRAALRGFGTAR